MPVAMTTSFDPEPERTEGSTQELPAIPTVQQMESWDEKEVLRWIKEKYRTILNGDNLENFNKACIGGITFLDSDVDFYETCRLPRGVGRALELLADKVKEEGEFIPRT
jgi:hypothetical protein